MLPAYTISILMLFQVTNLIGFGSTEFHSLKEKEYYYTTEEAVNNIPESGYFLTMLISY